MFLKKITFESFKRYKFSCSLIPPTYKSLITEF